MTRWLWEGLQSSGQYSVDIHDLATSSSDVLSRRIVRPSTWIRASLRQGCSQESGVSHWGANAVEVEFMRYRPRAELTRALNHYDLVQVVAGGPAIAAVAARVCVPVVLHVASRVAWERTSQRPGQDVLTRAWGEAMTRLTTRVERSAARSVGSVLVMNDGLLAYIRDLGQNNVSKATPGVDIQRFSPHGNGWRSDGHLLSVCRLADPRKGVHRIVRTYAEMIRSDKRVPDLVLAGRGTLSPATARVITDAGLTSRIKLLSDVAVKDLPDLYRSSSAFLQASYEEGLGLSVLEAMASGLPVVSTDTAGSRELVRHGITGWLVPQEEEKELPIAFARRVFDILDGEGASMSIQGRARAMEEFSADVTLKRFMDMYESELRRT